METSDQPQVAGAAPARVTPVDALPLDEYNFEHFRTRHLLYDVMGTIRTRGIPPGEPAPGFMLPRVGGGMMRLSDLQDRPTLLHFGSYT